MRHVDEYRDPDLSRRLLGEIARTVTRPWAVMEVCGGQTHALRQSGIDQLLPERLTVLHGPGCPVCVTPLEQIDRALAIAARPGVTFCSFGDMLRVPGSSSDLLRVRAEGGDVRVVYAPLDAVRLAKDHPSRQVVFFAVGFETTAPATALAARQARRLGLTNFSLLVSHVLVPPALEAILSAPGNRVQAFLAAGHVCAVTGYEAYFGLAARHRVPIVVTGFEPADLLEGLLMAVRQLEAGRHEVENQYARSVRRGGNPDAARVVAEVYEPCDRPWRGIGPIPRSGLRLRAAYRDLDAEERFAVTAIAPAEPAECRAGEVLVGRLRPDECPAFGRRCVPETPLGAPMVSGEGACAAYWKYRRVELGVRR
ncbi:MAG: hydrogenase formation protein HypD [Gemmataceae bacterium]